VLDFLFCLSSSCVLCTQCCPLIVYSWAPSVFCVRFSVLSVFLCTQDTGQRQTKQKIQHRKLKELKNRQSRGNIMYRRHRTCVHNVAPWLSILELLQFSLLDFLFCLSSSCVLCSQCCKFLWIVHCIFVFCLSWRSSRIDNQGATLCTQDTGRRQTKQKI
jgi:hypothetical protein